jgi:hypothetical protein
MAIGLIFQGTGVTPEQYQQVLDQVCPDNHPPPGMLYHAAGPGEEGMIVVDVFESPEALQRFEEQLRQARQQANITDHQVTIFPIINTMQP